MPRIHYTGRISTQLDFFINRVYGPLPADQHARLRDGLAEANPRGVSVVLNRLGEPVWFTHSGKYICLPDPRNLDADIQSCRNLSDRVSLASTLMDMDDRDKLHTALTELGPGVMDMLMSIEQLSRRHATTFNDVNTYAIGATAIATRRLGDFGTALARYEQKLKATAPGSNPGRAQLQSASAEFRNLQHNFALELKALANSNRYAGWMYPPYSSWAGGLEAAARNPQAPLADLGEVRRLKRILKATRNVGRGLLVVDLASRGNSVMRSDNPLKQSGEEASSFGTSAAFVWGAYRVTMFGMRFLLVSTPYGWLVIIGSLAIGALAAYAGDWAGRAGYRRLTGANPAPLVDLR
ncbi:MAG: hypothetical protein JJU06_01960 [Ectothiorhodospiraceae bacterium]|nr:hypothetical protein [Ectothiorhodospiraceae bacterium]MCH8503288.1 hypothetical protein [Ectothiorhodospiraceae bacterium]